MESSQRESAQPVYRNPKAHEKTGKAKENFDGSSGADERRRQHGIRAGTSHADRSANAEQERGFFRLEQHPSVQDRDGIAVELHAGRDVLSPECIRGSECLRMHSDEHLDAAGGDRDIFRGCHRSGECDSRHADSGPAGFLRSSGRGSGAGMEQREQCVGTGDRKRRGDGSDDVAADERLGAFNSRSVHEKDGDDQRPVDDGLMRKHTIFGTWRDQRYTEPGSGRSGQHFLGLLRLRGWSHEGRCELQRKPRGCYDRGNRKGQQQRQRFSGEQHSDCDDNGRYERSGHLRCGGNNRLPDRLPPKLPERRERPDPDQ